MSQSRNEESRILRERKPKNKNIEEEKAYVCKVCNKYFRFIGNLRTHERIHTGEKPFSCNICEKEFSQSSSLKTHKILHSGKKSYQCYICDKTFALKLYLTTHERCHFSNSCIIKTEDVRCTNCKKIFSSKEAVKQHGKRCLTVKKKCKDEK